MNKPAFELAQVIREYKQSFIQKHNPLKQHLRVLHAIEKCRTASLGGHVDKCDNCGHLRISYNSCRNRHCPKCQVTNKERWIMARQSRICGIAGELFSCGVYCSAGTEHMVSALSKADV